MGAGRLVSRVVCVVGACVAVSMLGAGVASGALTHDFASSFERGAGEPFLSVQGVAVDQASGDVYVYDAGAGEGAGAVYRFDSSGNPVGFSGVAGEPNVIEGVGSAGEGEGELAVDDSAGPARGDVYLATGSKVEVFSSAGVVLGELGEGAPGTPWGRPCGVAVDSAGRVLVGLAPSEGHESSSVNQYSPVASPVSSSDYTGSLWNLTNVCNVAVDSSGEVFADTLGDGPVSRFEAGQFSALSPGSGVPTPGVIVAESARSITVDPSTSDLYAAQYSQVSQYDPSGSLLDSFSGLGEGSFGNVHGVAVAGATGRVYVADDQHGRIAVFGPTVALADVATGPATNVTASTATLTGTVNPNGVPVVSCKFEYDYGNIPLYEHTAACAQGPGSGSGPVEVSADLVGLEPNTSYHYRLVVTNENGTSTGSGQALTTLSLPVIAWVQVNQLGDSEATVEAKINPMGTPTTYRVEYGPDTSYGTSVPVPDAPVGSGSGFVTVGQRITGLSSGTRYHYRVVATGANGVTDGQDWTFTTYAPLVASVDGCSNAQIRTAQGASYLPDCRAYEMVSPVDKDGGNVSAAQSRTRISADGNALEYLSLNGFGDAHGSGVIGFEYIAERGPDGWTSHGITPEQAPPVFPLELSLYVGDFSSDLSKGLFYAIAPVKSGTVTQADPNTEKVRNVYLRSDLRTAGNGAYELLSGCPACALTGPLQPEPFDVFASQDPMVAGASADLSHVIFESQQNLTTEAFGTSVKLYESVNGVLSLAGILPDNSCGAPPCVAREIFAGRGALASNASGRNATYTPNVISADGSRVIFTANTGRRPLGIAALGLGVSMSGIDGFAGDLYMREDGTHTVQLNVNERREPDTHQPAIYEGASRDGSKIFFETQQALTEDDTDGASPVVDLYMYDVNAPEGHHLTLITKEPEPKPNASTLSRSRQVTGVSEDGSYVYFSNEHPLLPGERENRYRHLYVWHDGMLHHIVDEKLGDTPLYTVWGEQTLGEDDFRVTPDGRYAVFGTRNHAAAAAAGFDNEDVTGACGGGGCLEVYVYSYAEDKLVCVSCDPSGQAAAGNADIGSRSVDTSTLTVTQHLNRAVSDDGSRVFFDTPDSLVPADTNGKRDVYEYNTITGEVSLISSGRSRDDSFFLEADPAGSNVMFMTSERLVRSEIDGNYDVYDARVDGGIPAQNAVAPALCEGDDCQGPAKAAPTLSLPSSLTFAGAGNQRVSPSSTVRVKGTRLSRAQGLARALRACRRRHGRRRVMCEARARKAYRASGVHASRHGSR